MFLHTAERFQDDYNIAVAMVAPPQVADRYGYELRLFDEAGFAYRGPMQSVVVRREEFWSQVSRYSRVFIFLTLLSRDITCIFQILMFWAAFLKQQSGYSSEDRR